MAYYGLFRVGELAASEDTHADSNHAIRVSNVQIGTNKDKILFILHSSKTHGKESPPQLIKIEANSRTAIRVQNSKRHSCPFTLMRQYSIIRGEYIDPNEQLFIFSDGTPVCPEHIRAVLKLCLRRLRLQEDLYGTHSWRIGHSTDLIKA